jgi:hypothetical protein
MKQPNLYSSHRNQNHFESKIKVQHQFETEYRRIISKNKMQTNMQEFNTHSDHEEES